MNFLQYFGVNEKKKVKNCICAIFELKFAKIKVRLAFCGGVHTPTIVSRYVD